MKYALALVLAIGIAADLSAQEEEVFPPQPIPPSHYEAMMKRSPFVLPAFTEETQSHSNWTDDYQIVSVLKIGEEYVVITKKMSSNERIPVRMKANAQGIRLVKLQMSPDPREVSAVVEMDGSEGTIQYDPTILSGIPRSALPNNPAIKSE